MEKKCKFCGSTKDMNPENYITSCKQHEIMKNDGICFSCATWKMHADNYNPNVFIYESDGKLCRTTTQRLLVNSATNLGFLGFGGHSWYIQMLENNEVFECNNLWFQGKIPEHFKDTKGLQKNCKLISREEYWNILREQGKGKMLISEVYQNIGQISIENALKEINRLNHQEADRKNINPDIVWRIDFSEYIFYTDETDEYVHNPCKLDEGYCWVTCVPQYYLISKSLNIPLWEGDRNYLYENKGVIINNFLEHSEIQLNPEDIIIVKNQHDYEEKIFDNI